MVAGKDHPIKDCSGTVESCNQHSRGRQPHRHKGHFLHPKVRGGSGHPHNGPRLQHSRRMVRSIGHRVEATALSSKSASPQNNAYFQSGQRTQNFRMSAKNPGQWEEAPMLISKAAHTHNTSGNGREYWTLGRGDAAYFQSGPLPQHFRKPPRTPDALYVDPQICYLNAVMQSVGIFHLTQLFFIHPKIMVHKHFLGNIGFFSFNCAAVISPFQDMTNYVPMNSKWTLNIINIC